MIAPFLNGHGFLVVWHWGIQVGEDALRHWVAGKNMVGDFGVGLEGEGRGREGWEKARVSALHSGEAHRVRVFRVQTVGW